MTIRILAALLLCATAACSGPEYVVFEEGPIAKPLLMTEYGATLDPSVPPVPEEAWLR